MEETRFYASPLSGWQLLVTALAFFYVAWLNFSSGDFFFAGFFFLVPLIYMIGIIRQKRIPLYTIEDDSLRNLMSVILIGFVSAASASTAEDMSELVNAWIGHSADELTDVWGEGLSMQSDSGHTMYIYSARGRGGSRFGVSASVGSVPVGGSRSPSGPVDELDRTLREHGGCDVTFEIRSGVIIDASWSTEGSPDRAKARRTCWREFRRNEAD